MGKITRYSRVHSITLHFYSCHVSLLHTFLELLQREMKSRKGSEGLIYTRTKRNGSKWNQSKTGTDRHCVCTETDGAVPLWPHLQLFCLVPVRTDRRKDNEPKRANTK